MAQKQFINYQADILSFEIGESHMGILNSGRYSGFNVLSTNGGPSGGNIPLKLSHTGGIQILGKGQVTLNDPIGVMVTTQGVIIHEYSEVTITITDNQAGGQKKYCLIYMEHEYQDGVEGDNPSFYGVINGASGAGVPALTNAYKRSIVGVIELAPGATSIAGCKYHPRLSENILGDSKVLQKLFGPNINLLLDSMGIIPSDGVIGNRSYTENNFIIDDESITDSLDLLDIVLGGLSEDLTEVSQRALDSEGWGALSDNTINNATITHHGLLPKLPNDATKWLNGLGQWGSIPQKRWKFKTTFNAEFNIDAFGNFVSDSGTLDLSAIVNTDTNVVYIRISYTVVNVNIVSSIGFKAYNANTSYIYATNAIGIQPLNLPFMVPIDPTTKKMDWFATNKNNIGTLVFFMEVIAQETAL